MIEEIKNCKLCGTGKSWWIRRGIIKRYYYCPTCQGNPLEGNGRVDWKDYSRARMIHQFGPRMDGDKELLDKYYNEINKCGIS